MFTMRPSGALQYAMVGVRSAGSTTTTGAVRAYAICAQE